MTAEFAIVEIMGHRRYGAKVRQVERYGATFLEATVLSDPPFVQLLSAASLFTVTPCSEEQARRACSGPWAHVVPGELRPKALDAGEIDSDIGDEPLRDQKEAPPDSDDAPSDDDRVDALRALRTITRCWEIVAREPISDLRPADFFGLVEDTCAEFIEAEDALPPWSGDREDYTFVAAVRNLVERVRALDGALAELAAVLRAPELASAATSDAERVRALGARCLALEGDSARLTRARDMLAAALLEVRSMLPPTGGLVSPPSPESPERWLKVGLAWVLDVTARIDRALIGAGDRSPGPKRITLPDGSTGELSEVENAR